MEVMNETFRIPVKMMSLSLFVLHISNLKLNNLACSSNWSQIYLAVTDPKTPFCNLAEVFFGHFLLLTAFLFFFMFLLS